VLIKAPSASLKEPPCKVLAGVQARPGRLSKAVPPELSQAS